MTSKKELQIAYGLAIILLVVGVLSYVAFPAKAPDRPMRIMFKSAAGKILFDHKTHVENYGISCSDCHHHFEEDETELRSCGECHIHPDQAEAEIQTCAECHDPDEVDVADALKRADAFHKQCIGCHEENEVEPVECAECHVM